ncbi:MAG: hypothetical protein JOZ16_03485 [Methylobacteriaceae bacterium]|nr:hypothetical protein [Methylobacteriaceae bacterium]
MSESRVVESALPSTAAHPRDLLARLYREIGISAVAAALQVQVDKPEPSTHIEASVPRLPKAHNLAA